MSDQTAANMAAFRAWAKETNASWAQKLEALNSGRFGKAWTLVARGAA